MSTFEARLNAVDHATLAPFVRLALMDEKAGVVDWRCQPITGGLSKELGLSYGVYRFSGAARLQDETVPWSFILKAAGPSGSAKVGSDTPTQWDYWKREVLVNQSGLLDDLSGGLVAPRCFAVVEYPGEEFWIWLEDIPEETGGAVYS